MKKIFSLIFLSICALMFLAGCGEDVDLDLIKKTYTDMTNMIVVEEENIFFSDELNPNTINISYSYSPSVEKTMKNDAPTMYRGYYYQQLILNNIFNFYEDNEKNFYLEMSNKEYKKKELEELYNKLIDLKNRLNDFKVSYDILKEEIILESPSDVLTIILENYAYELNLVIEASFDFMYDFIDLYEKYCINDDINEKNLNFRIDKAYVDVAHIIYLENFKSFNLQVSEKAGGVCDLVDLLENNSQYKLLEDLIEIKDVSPNVINNLVDTSPKYLEATEIVNGFIYYQNLFEQNYYHYINTYNDIDTYNTNQYRFELVDGVSYESYLESLSATKKAEVNMLTSFINECYNNLVLKLKLIIN